MKQVKIYALCEPGTEIIRYVGKTERSLEVRLKKHIQEKGNSYKCNWIKSLISKGSYPTIIELDTCSIEDWEWTEIYWIGQCKDWGFKLTNFQEGGLASSKENIDIIKKELGKKVYCLNIKTKEYKIFNSITECSDFLGLKKDTKIQRMVNCKDNIYSCKGYTCAFTLKKCYELLENKKNDRLKKQENLKVNYVRKVICVETQEVFNSIKEAATKFNSDTSSISKCCRGKLNKVAKYSFKYI
jgi:hypothetical protein